MRGAEQAAHLGRESASMRVGGGSIAQRPSKGQRVAGEAASIQAARSTGHQETNPHHQASLATVGLLTGQFAGHLKR